MSSIARIDNVASRIRVVMCVFPQISSLMFHLGVALLSWTLNEFAIPCTPGASFRVARLRRYICIAFFELL